MKTIGVKALKKRLSEILRERSDRADYQRSTDGMCTIGPYLLLNLAEHQKEHASQL